MFDDEQFTNVEGIRLCRNRSREYENECCAFQEIPPHHIVIQGKFLRVIHAKMQDLKMTRIRCRLDVAGTFALPKQRVWREIEHTLSSSSSDTSEDIEPDFFIGGPPGIWERPRIFVL